MSSKEVGIMTFEASHGESLAKVGLSTLVKNMVK
jgi:hypothetical protein